MVEEQLAKSYHQYAFAQMPIVFGVAFMAVAPSQSYLN
jgi:hypothetical protein